MTSTILYQHLPLEHEKSIRVLVLFPSHNRDDDIRFGLLPKRLYNSVLEDLEPTYEALSYTWGDPTDTARIYFDQDTNASLEVTRNCFNALKALRQRHDRRYLWIDAICINQNDLEERSRQVRLMARIFANASRTIIYLGEHTPSSRIVFQELAEAAVGPMKRCSACGQVKPFREKPGIHVVKGLEDLIQRPWFHRVWVLQEVVMNPERIVLCGEDTVSWKALDALFFGYKHLRVTKEPIPFAWDPQYFAGTGTSVWHILWICLHETRESLASDNRDKIFSLKALLGNEQDEVDQLIDYTKTQEETFTNLAKLLLCHFGLKLLRRVRHAHDLDMPSWVPDWSQNSPIPPPYGVPPFRFDSPAKIERNRTWTLGDSNTLGLQGWRCGPITELGDAFSFGDQLDTQRQLRSIISLTRSNGTKDLEGEDNLKEMRKKLPKGVLEVMSTFSSREMSEFLTAGYEQVESLEPIIEDLTTHQSYLVEMKDLLQRRRIFLCNDAERIGIAPDVAERGDIIAYIKGHSKPCVLRPADGGHWRLISGDGYARPFGAEHKMAEPIQHPRMLRRRNTQPGHDLGDPEEFILS